MANKRLYSNYDPNLPALLVKLLNIFYITISQLLCYTGKYTF